MMRKITSVCLIAISLLLFVTSVHAGVFYVNSQQSFDEARDNAVMNDSIIWESGTYSNIFMNISKDHLFIAAAKSGGTVFTGRSRVKITGDYISLQGFQFVDGDIGTNDVINTSGSYNHFNEINIRSYKSYKYLVIREECQYVNVTYCNFENRLNLDDKNILSILVDDTNPGYHKIQHCSFKNFDGTGNDLGIEPIRIGLSTQADRISRSLVEYCYFTQCNGDGELISNKARQNVFRYNTFEDNPKAELVLRHGSEAIVYGNFFLNGKGGVRVREGQNHYIYNNYFYKVDDRAIYLQNEDSDPLDNINIAFNTIVNCSEIILGGNGNYKPTNVTFVNNIFVDPLEELFEDPTGAETWIGNIASGKLGMVMPLSGISTVDPNLVENSSGFFGLSENSPAINAALPGYASLPQFEGMDGIDCEILYDIMSQERPQIIEEKDLGCSEYPHNILIQPIATEENTGPGYNTSILNSVKNNTNRDRDLFQVFPNPASSQINVILADNNPSELSIEIFDMKGRNISSVHYEPFYEEERSFSRNLSCRSSGIYTIRVSSRDHQNGTERIQSKKVIKL